MEAIEEGAVGGRNYKDEIIKQIEAITFTSGRNQSRRSTRNGSNQIDKKGRGAEAIRLPATCYPCRLSDACRIGLDLESCCRIWRMQGR